MSEPGATNVQLALDPVREDAYRYAVTVRGVLVGYVGHVRREDWRDRRPRQWYFRNDARGWYGTAGSQRKAAAALVDLSLRRGERP